MRRPTSFLAATLLGLVLAACGGDEKGSVGGGADGGVQIENFQFKPETVEVQAGTTITWTNGDDAPHTVKGDGGVFAESPQMSQGDTFRHTFGAAGRFTYICGIHNYMRGTIVVT